MLNENLGHRKRLRERYLKAGINSLQDYEIVELLLTYSISRKDCKSQAKELIKKFNSVENIIKLPKEDFLSIEGMGEASYALFCLINDIIINKFKKDIETKIYIGCTEELLNFLKQDIGYLKKEGFKVIFLNTQNIFLAEETISIGTIDKNYLYPREIIEKIIKYKAKSIIFAHNHPSGKVEPSNADIEFTLKMKEILKGIEINLLEHIIISENSYYSFNEMGII